MMDEKNMEGVWDEMEKKIRDEIEMKKLIV